MPTPIPVRDGVSTIRKRNRSWSVGNTSSTLSRSDTDTTQTRDREKVATSSWCVPRVTLILDGSPHVVVRCGR